jgi:hypothetical protein
MFLRWHVYPSSGFITDEHINRLPFPPFERFGHYVAYQTPVWDANIQMYVDEWVYKFVGLRDNFHQAFNGHCSHHLEVHGCGGYTFSNLWLREFINGDGQIVLCQS